MNNVSRNGLIYSYSNKNEFINKNNVFLKNIWSADVNELSEIFNSNEDTYNIIEVVNENLEELPPFEKIKTKVYDEWLIQEMVLKSKQKAKESIIKNNNNLLSKVSIERTSKSIDKINDTFLINKIFDIQNKEINYLQSKNFIVAVKILNIKTKNYDINKKIKNNLHLSLSQSFFNDFSNFYLQNLAIKHKLKRNIKEIDKFLGNQDIIN